MEISRPQCLQRRCPSLNAGTGQGIKSSDSGSRCACKEAISSLLEQTPQHVGHDSTDRGLCVVRRTMSTVASGAPPSIAEEEDPDIPAVAYARKHTYMPVHFGVYIALPNFFSVLTRLWMAFWVLALAMFAIGWRLLLRFLEFFSFGLFQGGGPSKEQVAAARFKLWFVGKGYSDSTMATSSNAPPPDMQITTSVSSPEIGYVAMPICLVQCALVVLDQRRTLPRGGVYTPGTVFGIAEYQHRLEDNDIPFDFVSKQNV